MKPQRLLLVLLAFFLMSGCAALLPASYKSGKSMLDQGNYRGALTDLQIAYQEKPDNYDVALAVIQANYGMAESNFKQFGELGDDLPGKTAVLTSAKEYNSRGKEVLDKYEATKQGGGGDFATKLKLSLEKVKAKIKKDTVSSEDIMLQHKKLLAQQSSLVAQALFENEELRTSVLKTNSDAAELSNTDIVASYDAAAPLEKYRNYMPEVEQTYSDITNRLVAHYEKLGLEAVELAKYEEAQELFTKANEVIDDNKYSKAGMLAITADQQYKSAQYIPAYKTVIEIEQVHPESEYVKAHKIAYLETLVKEEMKKAEKYAASTDVRQLIASLDIYAFISEYASADADILASVQEKVSMVKVKISDIFKARAKKLYETDKVKYSGVTLLLMRTAFAFNPMMELNEEDMVFDEQGINEEKQKLRAYLQVIDKTGENHSLQENIFGNVSMKIDEAPLYMVSSRDNKAQAEFTSEQLLSMANEELRMSELAVTVSVDVSDFREQGFDKPYRKYSEYISGTRMVHNPDWDTAQENARQAQQTYDSMLAARQEAIKSCNQLSNPLLQGICRAGVNMVSSSHKNKMQAIANSTPREIEEDVISSYSYDEYNVSVRGNIRATVNFYDRRGKKRLQAVRINEKIEKKGQILENVEYTDTHGLKNARINVPELQNEKAALENYVVKQITDAVMAQVADLDKKRFFAELDKWKKLGKKNDIAESYMIMKANGSIDTVKDEADSFIREYISITADERRKHGMSDEQLRAQWPKNPDMPSDEEMDMIATSYM